MQILSPVQATDLTPGDVREFYMAQGLTERQADHKARQLGEWVTEYTFEVADPWSWITADVIGFLPKAALIRLGAFCGKRMRASDDKSLSMLASAGAVPVSDRATFLAYNSAYCKAARESERWGELQALTWEARA